MRKGYLSEYFTGVASKRLSAVEALRHRSHQHEFDGVGSLRAMFGSERRTFQARFVYLNDEDPDPISDSAELTWYDARENHQRRTEYRLYFTDNVVSTNASDGDLLVIAKCRDCTVLVIVAENGSTIERQILWLFGLSPAAHPGFSVKGELESDQTRLEFASRFILEQIGIEIEETDGTLLDTMLQKFGGGFPSTREFSAFARSKVPGIGPLDDPDEAIMAWIEREEILFRTLERHIIGDRLSRGFGHDVDGFIQFSLSVQNRRKSRAGSALENHLEYLFKARGLDFSRTPRTEGRSQPDFLFPGEKEYHAPEFPEDRLTMLGVKSSCKERWRQVLAEADRIQKKHLFTLEPSISQHQTKEMEMKGVVLVLPEAIRATYSSLQAINIYTLGMFIEHVVAQQAPNRTLPKRGADGHGPRD